MKASNGDIVKERSLEEDEVNLTAAIVWRVSLKNLLILQKHACTITYRTSCYYADGEWGSQLQNMQLVPLAELRLEGLV